MYNDCKNLETPPNYVSGSGYVVAGVVTGKERERSNGGTYPIIAYQVALLEDRDDPAFKYYDLVPVVVGIDCRPMLASESLSVFGTDPDSGKPAAMEWAIATTENDVEEARRAAWKHADTRLSEEGI